MFLYRNADYFEGTMNIRTFGGEEMPVQLWSMDMSWDRPKASFVRFGNYFASRLRGILTMNPPRIPTQLHDFLRPKERLPLLRIEHNWGDVIPYPVSTVIRVYGIPGEPHVLPFHVPFRLGFAEVIWKIGCIYDK